MGIGLNEEVVHNDCYPFFKITWKHESDDERNTIALVQFAEASRTVLVFRVVKKLNILSLRAMAAAKVSRCFLKIDDIEKLDASLVPEAVVPDILSVSVYLRKPFNSTNVAKLNPH